jgi:hypothetical protein
MCAVRLDRQSDNDELREAEWVALESAARDGFEQILRDLRGEAQALELHEVERRIYRALLPLGRTLMRGFLAHKGTGYAGPRVTRNEREYQYHSTKSRSYLSIFGGLEIRRAYYWGSEPKGVFPLDADLNLPKERYSYLLQNWVELLATDGSFQTASDRLVQLLGVRFWTQGAQHVARTAAQDVQGFYDQKGPPPEESEGPILVGTVDGKGVPIRREEPRPRKPRLKCGEKPNKKKEAVVTVAYTVDTRLRSPRDVVREIGEDGGMVSPSHDLPKRPKPQNKVARATLGGKEKALLELTRQMKERDPNREKPWVVVLDGDPRLQRQVIETVGKANKITLVLDIMHALNYVWDAAYSYHEKGSPEAARWVMRKLELLLEGKVGYVIGQLKTRLNSYELSKGRQKLLERAIGYLEKNRALMAYDVYLAKGFPIGSGVVEGACRHLVKDRMEQTGMRWSLDGADAVLELRAVEINGDWESLWTYHASRQRERLYGAGSRPAKVRPNAA